MARSSFDLKREIEKYATSLTSDIFSPKKRAEIKREYAEHIEDSVYRYRLGGMSDKEAFKHACEDMGEMAKVRCLLAEVHNNKVQIFIIDNVLKKLRNFFTSKMFFIICIAIVILALLTVFTWPVALFVFSDIYGYCQSLFSNVSFWLTFGLVSAAIGVFVLFIVLVLPLLVWLVKKLSIYAFLFRLSLFSKYKVKIVRNPFASFKEMSAVGDITISTKERIYAIHFIDIVFPHRRALTFPNNFEYVITPALPSKVSKFGGSIGINMSGSRTLAFGITEHSLERNKDKKRSLPKVETDDKVIHLLLIPNPPIETKYVKNGSVISLSSGDRIGHITYCSLSYLKRGLNNKLHTSIFD